MNSLKFMLHVFVHFILWRNIESVLTTFCLFFFFFVYRVFKYIWGKQDRGNCKFSFSFSSAFCWYLWCYTYIVVVDWNVVLVSLFSLKAETLQQNPCRLHLYLAFYVSFNISLVLYLVFFFLLVALWNL